MSLVRKRSVTIRGHRTSFSLEQPFLDDLRMIAAARGVTLAALVAEIDADRPRTANLSSALRIFVLDQAKRRKSLNFSSPEQRFPEAVHCDSGRRSPTGCPAASAWTKTRTVGRVAAWLGMPTRLAGRRTFCKTPTGSLLLCRTFAGLFPSGSGLLGFPAVLLLRRRPRFFRLRLRSRLAPQRAACSYSSLVGFGLDLRPLQLCAPAASVASRACSSAACLAFASAARRAFSSACRLAFASAFSRAFSRASRLISASASAFSRAFSAACRLIIASASAFSRASSFCAAPFLNHAVVVAFQRRVVAHLPPQPLLFEQRRLHRLDARLLDLECPLRQELRQRLAVERLGRRTERAVHAEAQRRFGSHQRLFARP